MKMEEIKKLSDKEINAKVNELKKHLFDLRFKQATGKLETVADIRNTRKTIARLLTELNERKNG